MADNSMTGTFKLNLPKDLLSEATRAPQVKTEQLRVIGCNGHEHTRGDGCQSFSTVHSTR